MRWKWGGVAYVACESITIAVEKEVVNMKRFERMAVIAAAGCLGAAAPVHA